MSHEKHFDKPYKCQHCHKGFSLEMALKRHYSRQHPDIVKEDLFCEKCGIHYKQKCKTCIPKCKCNDCGQELSRRSLKRHKLTCKALKLNCIDDLMETEPKNVDGKTVNNDEDDIDVVAEIEVEVNHDEIEIDVEVNNDMDEIEVVVNNDEDEIEVVENDDEDEIEVIEKINVPGSKYQCEKCEKTFVFQSKLKRHIKCHIRQSGKKCPVCQKYFKNSNSLSTHINKFHMI